MEDQAVYIVSDIGPVSPTLGIVLQAFSTLEKAKEFCLKTRNEDNNIHEYPTDICITKQYLDQINFSESIDF